jgi:hypothetical protein
LRQKKLEKIIAAKIQAMARVEGLSDDILLDSLLTGTAISSSISGIENRYTTYTEQIKAIYEKYNNDDTYGCAQTRALIDMRTAFIAGQGISVICENDNTINWINKYIKRNKLNSSKFFNLVKSGEMAGQTILYNKEIDGEVILKRYLYQKEYPYNYMPYVKNKYDYDNLKTVVRDKVNNKEELKIFNSDFIHVILGGDDILSYGPTTKIGLVLNEIENYDRALKDMRRLNHLFARITPTIKTKGASEQKQITSDLKKSGWKIGNMFISTAELKYEVPQVGAHQNLKDEMVTNLKTISSVTGMPVHWLGYVDLMSNRSTAETLYEFINISTLLEREIWSSAIYDIIIDAQRLSIDNGIGELKEINYDFEIRIPLIDYTNFLHRVQALSIAFSDQAISMDDYRSNIPGINPTLTKKAIEKETAEFNKKLIDTNPEIFSGDEN